MAATTRAFPLISDRRAEDVQIAIDKWDGLAAHWEADARDMARIGFTQLAESDARSAEQCRQFAARLRRLFGEYLD